MKIRRHTEVIDAEHRQGHQKQNQYETADYPGILHVRLKVGSGQADDDAEHRVGGRHRQHVDQRQAQCTGRTGISTRDHTGQNRNHRQYARRERQQQAESSEHDETPD